MSECEIDLEDFLTRIEKLLSKKYIKKLELYLDSHREPTTGDVVLITEELIAFLVSECKLELKEVLKILLELGLNEKDINYIHRLFSENALVRPYGYSR
ncbi:MAG: hypothetical protein DRJ49_03700 [Thermoprotei archaeon]|nr:MAG: hypothetical protein DRN53_02455 [Thermoprotei archaeon]RLE89209.1 MAG: hypothetical protein DRJ49_03700 [Thermoprotei archaeon]